MSKLLFYVGSFLSCIVLAFSTVGCMSGGFKITRGYARWVNSQHIVLRVIIYIFTTVVFGITMLIDAVIFNTVDFWQGKVSQGDSQFKDAGKVYHVKHEILPGSNLKRSTIHVKDEAGKALQLIVLNETMTGEIEMSVDGVVRSRVRDITSIPIVAVFDKAGKLVEENPLFLTNFDSNKLIARH